MEKILIGRDFERIVVELFRRIFGVEYVKTEVRLKHLERTYIADMVIDNKYMVEIKLYRNQISLEILDNLASRLNDFLEASNYVEGIIVVSNNISAEYKKELLKKHPKFTFIDINKLIEYSEHFSDIKYKLYSYKGISQE